MKKKGQGKNNDVEKNKKIEKKQQPILECVKKNGQGYLITIEAKPNAKNTKVTEINSEYVGVSIAAPPREGQANQELSLYIAQLLQARKGGVYVEKGGKSRHKMVIVQQCLLSIEDVMTRLQDQI